MGIIRIHHIVLILCCFCTFTSQGQKQHKIALLLPFNNDLSSEYQGTQAQQLGDMCRSYYKGLRLALDSLASADHAIQLYVYDTKNDSQTTATIIQKKEFKQADLIIGPVLQGGNKMVSDIARQQRMYQISPLMTFSKSKIGDEYWVSAHPDLPSYGVILCRYLTATTKDTIQLIVVSDNGTHDKAITPQIKKTVSENKRLILRVIDAQSGEDINASLHPNRRNCVLINSTKEQVVSKWLYRIHDTTKPIYPEVFGFQQWFDFKNTEYQLWQRKNVRILTPYFINYSDPAVIAFVQKYRTIYGEEPTEEAFKGYDQAMYFISLLKLNGKSLFSGNALNPYEALHTRYAFEKDKTGKQYKTMYLHILRFEGDNLISSPY